MWAFFSPISVRTRWIASSSRRNPASPHGGQYLLRALHVEIRLLQAGERGALEVLRRRRRAHGGEVHFLRRDEALVRLRDDPPHLLGERRRLEPLADPVGDRVDARGLPEVEGGERLGDEVLERRRLDERLVDLGRDHEPGQLRS